MKRRRDQLKATDLEALKRADAAKRARDPRTFWARATINAVRVRSKKQGWPCDLTWDYLLSIVGDACPVFGVPYDFTGGTKRFKPNSPSVDRIDPAGRYLKSNIVVVSMRANAIKRDATIEELQKLAAFYGALANDPACSSVGAAFLDSRNP